MHPYPSPILFLEGGQAATQFQVGIHLSIHADAFLKRENLRQRIQVDGGAGMKGDVRVGEQVVHFHIGQYVGVGAFELEDFQVQARGGIPHEVYPGGKVGVYLVYAVRQPGVSGESIFYLDVQRGKGHLLLAVHAFQRADETYFSSCRYFRLFQDALRNHVQYGFQRGGVQPVLQIDVERFGCGVAAHGSFYSQFRTVDVNHGIVQEQGVPGGIQFKVGAQVGGDAVCQQLPVLPEEKVLVAEIYCQHGMAFLHIGFQGKVCVP